MLEGIKRILNTMGEALTFADAGEMLTRRQKAEVLARHQRPALFESGDQPPKPKPDGAVSRMREHGDIIHAWQPKKPVRRIYQHYLELSN